jgi:hypothetical protein
MAVINVTEEAHARAKEMASAAGTSLSAWASERLLGEQVQTTYDTTWLLPLGEMALERSEKPAETLEAALAALAAPVGIVRPAVKETPLHPDGMPYCSCDGPSEAGSHHKTGCARHR